MSDAIELMPRDPEANQIEAAISLLDEKRHQFIKEGRRLLKRPSQDPEVQEDWLGYANYYDSAFDMALKAIADDQIKSLPHKVDLIATLLVSEKSELEEGFLKQIAATTDTSTHVELEQLTESVTATLQQYFKDQDSSQFISSLTADHCARVRLITGNVLREISSGWKSNVQLAGKIALRQGFEFAKIGITAALVVSILEQRRRRQND